MKRIVLIFFLLVATLATYAQVREFPIGALQNSIVRTVDEDTVLIYTQPAADTGYFLLYRQDDATALAFRMPHWVHVRDVRIFDGRRAYFCGYSDAYASTPRQGVVGCFDLLDFQAGLVSLNYGIIQWTAPSAWMYPADLQRLALFTAGDTVCMAMAGQCLGDFYNHMDIPSVASAWFDGTGWQVRTLTYKGDPVRFTDIACLDNFIVATGHGVSDSSCYVKTFHPVRDFPGHPCVAGYAHRVSYSTAKGDPLVARYAGDTAVVAAFVEEDGVRTVLHRLEMDNMGRPMPVDTWITDSGAAAPYGSGWRQRELAVGHGQVWLLQQSNHPVQQNASIRDWLLRVAYPAAGVWGTIDAWRPAPDRCRSMDLDKAGWMPWVSAIGNRLTVHYPNWPTVDGDCQTHHEWNLSRKEMTVDYRPMPEGMSAFARGQKELYPVVTVKCSVSCSE